MLFPWNRPEPLTPQERDRVLTVLERLATVLERAVEQWVPGSSAPLQPVVEEPPLPIIVQQALEERSVEGSPERRQIRREAQRLLKQGMAPEDVKAAVLQGEPVEW